MEKRLSQIYVYSMLTVFLFFTGFKGYTAIFDSKCIVFTVLSFAYVLGSSLFGLPKKLKLPEIFALVYLFVSVISALASEYFPETMVGATRYEGVLTIFLYVSVFLFLSQNWQTPNSFVPFLATVMLVESVIVFIQLLDINIFLLYPRGENYHVALEKYNGAFISTIGNADIASAFFSLMTPVLWSFFFDVKRSRLLVFASALSSLLATVFMSVTAGIVALVVTLAVVLPLRFTTKKKAFVFIAILVIIVLLVLYFVPIGRGTLFELHSLLNGRVDSDFGSGRLHIWKETVTNIKNIWLGSGPDTMIYCDLEPFTRVDGERVITRKIDVAHNDYLNVLFHQGFFALIALVGLIITALKGSQSSDSSLVRALGAGALSYSTHVFFSYSSCSSAIFFWMVLGLLRAENGLREHKKGV